MEMLEVFDEFHNKTDELIERGNHNLNDDRYIGIVLVFILNNYGEFLIQKTSKEKGDVFATTGGHISKGDTSINTVIKEVKEELGIDINEKDIELFKIYKHSHVYCDVYYMSKDININNLNLQKEEVEYVEWMSISSINKLINIGMFRKGNITPFHELIDFLNNKNML